MVSFFFCFPPSVSPLSLSLFPLDCLFRFTSSLPPYHSLYPSFSFSFSSSSYYTFFSPPSSFFSVLFCFSAVCRAFGVSKVNQEAFLAQGMAYSRICDLVNAEKTDLSEQGKKVVNELLA